MDGLIKLLFAVGITYCIVSWSMGNPQKASNFVEKVDGAYKTASEVIADTFFDKENADNQQQKE